MVFAVKPTSFLKSAAESAIVFFVIASVMVGEPGGKTGHDSRSLKRSWDLIKKRLTYIYPEVFNI